MNPLSCRRTAPYRVDVGPLSASRIPLTDVTEVGFSSRWDGPWAPLRSLSPDAGLPVTPGDAGRDERGSR